MIHLADHSRGVSHYAVKRLLQRNKLTGGIIWEHSQYDIVLSPKGCLVFDDSVFDDSVLDAPPYTQGQAQDAEQECIESAANTTAARVSLVTKPITVTGSFFGKLLNW
jgi:hypothetical protein